MQLVRQSIEFNWMTPDPLKQIEKIGRTCYKSEDLITETSHIQFVQKLLNAKPVHGAMLEHAVYSVHVTCDRGISHEMVRHRIASYAQESTRYCNYAKKGVVFIIPNWLSLIPGKYRYDIHSQLWQLNGELMHLPEEALMWLTSMKIAAEQYEALLDFRKWKPEQARAVLPNSLKTEIHMTANFREWRHFFSLRLAKKAHPQMREVANLILQDLKSRVPVVFDDLKLEE